MKSRELRKIIEKMINICDRSVYNGEMTVRAYDRIDKVRKEYENLCEQEEFIDEETRKTEEEFKNYVKEV